MKNSIASIIIIISFASIMVAGCSDLAKPSAEEIRAIAIQLKDEDPEVREKAAYELGKIGPEALCVSNELQDVLADQVPYVRATAVWAIETITDDIYQINIDIEPGGLLEEWDDVSKYIDSDERPYINALLSMINDKSRQRRLTAMYLLWELGEVPKHAAYPIMDNLRNNDPRIRYWACNLLGDCEIPFTEIIQSVIRLLDDEDEAVRFNAVDTLGELRAPADEVIPSLLPILRNRDETRKIRIAVISTIGSYGKEAANAAPALVEIVENNSGRIVIIAAQALLDINSNQELALNALIAGLEDNETRYMALTVLSFSEQIHANAAIVLIETFKDEDPYIRALAAGAFSWIDPEPEVIEALIIALGSEQWQVKSTAAIAIGFIGPEAKDAIPYLIEALDYGQISVMNSAAKALGDMGPLAEQALPKLRELVGSIPANEAWAVDVFNSAIQKIEAHQDY